MKLSTFYLLLCTLFMALLSPFQAEAILLKPEDFGAVIDDGLPDDEAFQAMFDAIPKNELNVVIELMPGQYLFEKTVFYSKRNRRRTMIDGNHATIKAVGLEFDLLTPKADRDADVEEALVKMDKLVVRDLSFEGGDTQLRLAATLNSEISNCEFVSGNRGVDLVFCLMARVVNCQFTRQKVEQLLVRSAQGDPMTGESKYLRDATGSNSQSNMVTVDGCRFFSELHAHACIRNYGSNSLSVTNTVFEGLAPRYSVDYHDRNSTTCTYLFMRNIHIEHPFDTLFTKALIHAEQNGGIVHLDGIYSQTGRTVQVDAGRSVVKLSNWAYVPGGAKFKANGVGEWIFEDVRMMQNFELNDPDLWVGDPPPYVVDRFASTIRTEGGWSPTMRSGEEYWSFTEDRILLTNHQTFDQQTLPMQGPKELADYEIVDLRPLLMIDPETGETVTYYQPVIKKKGEEPMVVEVIE
ncbi:hypothetical protein [Sanyastnella coralliicola]|uniref:hypothetical protein n=1 Tax=Sanyastnella coralliicola TaxID=3069118 RepID=UPI0027BA1E6F|nr:hypothetical protein [Longitalea sp. SCSIO 12813]